MELSEFFTWEYLATFAGCMVATGLVTQMVKGALDKVVERLQQHGCTVELLGMNANSQRLIQRMKT